MHRLEHVLLTLWAGGLWTICGLVAPSAFAILERSAAGALVGSLFWIAAWGGACIGLALLVIPAAWRRAGHAPRTLITVAGASPLVSELVLGPLMREARVAGDLQRFGLLHGASALLFVVACLCTFALVWKINRAE